MQVVGQPLGPGRARRRRRRREVPGAARRATKASERGLLGVLEQQVEHGRRAHVAAVAAAVGDRALRGDQDGVEHGAVDVEPRRTVVVAPQQAAQLQRPLEARARPRAGASRRRGPCSAVTPWSARHAGEHPPGARRRSAGSGVLRCELRRPARSMAAERAPDVARELVADARGASRSPRATGRPTRPAAVERAAAELGRRGRRRLRARPARRHGAASSSTCERPARTGASAAAPGSRLGERRGSTRTGAAVSSARSA